MPSWRFSINNPATGYIADLSYRNYDGPMEPPIRRWWAIARMSIRLSMQKRAFWVWAAFSGWYFLVLSIAFYVGDTIAQSTGRAVSFYSTIRWDDQFLDAFSHGQIFFLILALLIGVGAIANDNRANALLVYLSKPCTKADYLIGKWFGVFIPLTCVIALPTVLFYFYCLMSYRSYGFFSQDPWLLLKLLSIAPFTAAFHTSVSLGISSMFNQGRLAGAVYAGLYFITNLFTWMIGGVRMGQQFTGRSYPPILDTIFYGSVDGVQIAIAKIIMGSPGSRPFFAQGGRRALQTTVPPIPSAALFFGIFFVACIVGVWIAWSRIRAVEVVGS